MRRVGPVENKKKRSSNIDSLVDDLKFFSLNEVKAFDVRTNDASASNVRNYRVVDDANTFDVSENAIKITTIFN